MQCDVRSFVRSPSLSLALLAATSPSACSLEDPDDFADSGVDSWEDCEEEEEDCEFRVEGDSLAVTQFAVKCCASVANAGLVISSDTACSGSNFGTYADGCASTKVPTICLASGLEITILDDHDDPIPRADPGDGIDWFSVPGSNWVSPNNSFSWNCRGTTLYANAGDHWQLYEDEINDVENVAPGEADQCMDHSGFSDGCMAAEATTWRLDGSSAMMCCRDDWPLAGAYRCTPPYDGSDDCSGMDGFTVPAICIPCEGHADFPTGQNDQIDNAGNNRGAWDLSNDTGDESDVPTDGEWAGTQDCADGTADEPNGTNSDCHYTLYGCQGDLRSATDGTLLDWTNSDECGAMD